jgi:large repetitive protein
VTGAWTSLGFPPFEMHHLQPVVVGDRLWIVGAFTGDYPNETAIGDVWTYHPATDSWQVGPPIPPARRRGSAGVAVWDGAIWIVGGNTQGHAGGYVPWFDRFDPATGAWTVMPDAPHARDHFTAVVVGNRLVAAGGRQTRLPNPFLHTVGPVDVFDFSLGSWTSFPSPLPTLRAGTMTVASGPHVVVIGGESATTAHREVEALHSGTGNWQSLPPLIQGRHSGGAAIRSAIIHCACGASGITVHAPVAGSKRSNHGT